jgi:hypothetical protein
MRTDSRTASSRQALAGLKDGQTRTAVCPHCQYDKPSLSITRKGDRLLVWCFNRCTDQRQLFRRVAADLRAGRVDWATVSWGRQVQEQSEDEYEAARKREDRARRAHETWLAAKPAADHPVARAYLERRGCVIPRADGPYYLAHLRAVDSAFHPPTGTTWPALVALVTCHESDTFLGVPVPGTHAISLHTTYLARDGSGKAPVEPSRLFAAGLPSKGVVLLTTGEHGHHHLGVAEGLETALSLAHAVPSVWACLNAGNLAELPLPILGKPQMLTIAVDRDPAGERAANACARRWHAAGVKVRLVMPDQGDVNDLVGG